MKQRYVAALALFLVGLSVGAVLIWFILPATVTLQPAGPLPGPASSATPSASNIAAELGKCQPLLDNCSAYRDCVAREAGAAIANGLPDCSAPAASSASTGGDIILCFSPPVPPQGCDPMAAAIHAIDTARRTIWLQTYVLTSQTTVDALLKAYGRHVAISLIVDKAMLQQQPQLVLSLAQAGLAIRVDDSVRGMARSSVMIVDGTTAMSGSFDFTNEAERWNADDLLITNRSALVARYRENWNFHLVHSEPVKLPATPSASASPSASPSPTPAPRRSGKGSKSPIPPPVTTKPTPGR